MKINKDTFSKIKVKSDLLKGSKNPKEKEEENFG